jgi:hypothetical protein
VYPYSTPTTIGIIVDVRVAFKGCAPFSRNPIQFSDIKIPISNEKIAKLYQYLSY